MPFAPKPVTRLIEEFSRLPGIGPKTASRLTFYLLRSDDEQVKALAEAIRELKERITFCSECYNISESSTCAICEDPSRDRGLLCVVEEPLDVLALERAGGYEGLYHVLHGVISPMEGIEPSDLRIPELVERVRDGQFREVVLATNPSLEGEATAMYIHRQLAPLGVRITRLARGLPVGGDLEYADNVTLVQAFEGRQEVKE
ncbi:MAG: recombination mediator RecR [Chloroflexota bacterium]|nr:recombination mediator RecR [Chloroflexota bacterium]